MKYNVLYLVTLFFCLQLNGQKKFQDTIPFRSDLGLITIPINFNGVAKQFLFDTGASHSIGFSWVQDELKPTGKFINVSSSGGNRSRLRYYKSGKINLGSVKISKHKILKTKDSEIFSCYAMDGVLGVDIISEFNWIIDFKEKYLIMYPKDVIPESTKEMHAMTLQHKRRPYLIFNSPADRAVSFLLDTGATSSDINNKIELDDESKNPSDYVVYSGSYDFNGKRKNSVLNVLKRSFTSMDVSINGIFDYGIQSSKIGNRLWRNKRLFLSKKQQLFLIDDPKLDEFRTNYDCSFVVEKNEILIGHVVVDSEAWNKGVRQGDKIKSLNGKSFSSFCELAKYQTAAAEKNLPIIATLDDGSSIELQRLERFEAP